MGAKKRNSKDKARPEKTITQKQQAKQLFKQQKTGPRSERRTLGISEGKEMSGKRREEGGEKGQKKEERSKHTDQPEGRDGAARRRE